MMHDNPKDLLIQARDIANNFYPDDSYEEFLTTLDRIHCIVVNAYAMPRILSEKREYSYMSCFHEIKSEYFGVLAVDRSDNRQPLYNIRNNITWMIGLIEQEEKMNGQA